MKSSSKVNKIYNWSFVFLAIGCVISSLFLSIIINSLRNSSSEVKSADGYTIESYKVVLDVSENNSIDVKEDITVDFYENGHHGIYRFIPEWLEYTAKDNKTISRKAKVSNLISYSDDYSVGIVNGKKQIKIGNANKTLPKGLHTYTIGYTYDMRGDLYENFDEFIFHAFGDFWGTRINNAIVEIHLPKNVNVNDNIHFYSDKYRKKDITSYVDYNVSENTIYAKLSPNYSLDNSLTIDLELPDGYFENVTNNYGHLSLLLCIICIVFAIITLLLWVRNGKDLAEDSTTVGFYPPGQLDASQIGYLYKRDHGRKLTVALIVQLASKGFIKIIESEDKQRQTIVKQVDYIDVNKAINRKIKIMKIRDYNGKQSINAYWMKKYFSKSNEYTITKRFDDFYKNVEYLIKNNYIKVESDTINDYSDEELEKIKKSLAENEFKNVPKMTENEELVYNQLFKYRDETVLSQNYTFYEVFYKVRENLINEFDDKINDLKAYKSMLLTSIGFAVCSLFCGLAYCIIEDMNPKLQFIYSLGAISNVIIFIFSILMKRKNSYGEQMKSKINEFKKNIEFIKKEQIDLLVEKNPSYFYDILPYAYVLNISKKWIEKFESIPTPTRNNANKFNYYSLDNLFISIESSSSGSSSGCGGGCSSCGGGGSW